MLPGWERRFQGNEANLEGLLDRFSVELEKSGFKVKVNKKKMSLEATYESVVDRSWGQVVISGEPNDFILRIDWDADLRKLFWVNLAVKAPLLVREVSFARPKAEKVSWSPSEEVTGEATMDMPPDLADLKKKTEAELDGKRSILLAQADILEKEGNFEEAAKFYLKAAVISRELGEKVYAEEFERKAEELKKRK
ncbi:MAG: hypothetical protein KIH01_08560 [Candidatus Freyarchaeota archaeon]|nr:hypothetical protein [Candidatus Jordarchaeia archaeon]